MGLNTASQTSDKLECRVYEPLTGRMGLGVRWLLDRFYPNYRGENERFADVVALYLRPDSSVLDAGCGTGNFLLYPWKDFVRRLIGCDLDPAVRENQRVHAAVVSQLDLMPFENQSFDVVFSRYVWEHLAEPDAVFTEMARILKPGGTLVILTPNGHHYVPLVSRFSSYLIHRKISVLRGNAAEDAFPTYYRANTPGDLSRMGELAGLKLRHLKMVEARPNYLLWSLPAFLVGLAYERAVNRLAFLSRWRVSMIAVFERGE